MSCYVRLREAILLVRDLFFARTSGFFLGFHKATAFLLLCFPSAFPATPAADDEYGCVDESVTDVAIDTNDSDLTISLITITNISNGFINATISIVSSRYRRIISVINGIICILVNLIMVINYQLCGVKCVVLMKLTLMLPLLYISFFLSYSLIADHVQPQWYFSFIRLLRE